MKNKISEFSELFKLKKVSSNCDTNTTFDFVGKKKVS